MKKFFFGLCIIAGILFASQLNMKNTNSISDLNLMQLTKNAEACVETSTGGCCFVWSNSWCYIGGGYEIYPFSPPWA